MINNTTDLTFKEKQNIKTHFLCALFIHVDIIGILLKKFLIQVKVFK